MVTPIVQKKTTLRKPGECTYCWPVCVRFAYWHHRWKQRKANGKESQGCQHSTRTGPRSAIRSSVKNGRLTVTACSSLQINRWFRWTQTLLSECCYISWMPPAELNRSCTWIKAPSTICRRQQLSGDLTNCNSTPLYSPLIMCACLVI